MVVGVGGVLMGEMPGEINLLFILHMKSNRF